jgi:hypothetical protein
MAQNVELDLPGAGVPAWQRLVGKHVFLPWYTARLSWDGARDLLRREGHGLMRMADGRHPDDLARPVLVPPLIGLEDSSRNWSYAMVLEHLCIIGRETAEIIIELSHGRAPQRPAVNTAELKPLGTLSAGGALAGFHGFLEEFHRSMEADIGDRRSHARFAHPWFGPLTARQWICFLPFHQRLHMGQARHILRRLPRVGPA